MARVIRGKVLSLRELDFVQAARAVGVPDRTILARHILPNVMGPLVVLATMGIALMILFESALSYLGLGVAPPAPTWGAMISEGQPYFRTAPWLVLVPGIAILLTVLGFNLLGEGLRDAFDPRDAQR
jgi:ABC-type dipeptide/oligopeptide/nickel transport system permease subunit